MRKIVGIFIFSFFLGLKASAQTIFHYGETFKQEPFLLVHSKKKVKLPQAGNPILFFFSYADGANYYEVPFLISFKRGYGKRFDIYRVIYSQKSINKGDLLPLVLDLNKNEFDFDIYNRNKIMVLDQKRIVRYFGNMESPHSFITILQNSGSNIEKPHPDNLHEFYTNVLSLGAIPVPKDKNNKLVILLRSVCGKCHTNYDINFIVNALKSMKYDLSVTLIFRNKEVKQRFKKITESLNVNNFIDHYFIASQNKRSARLFVYGNPLLLTFSKNNAFIKYKVADKARKQDIIRFLQRSFE